MFGLFHKIMQLVSLQFFSIMMCKKKINLMRRVYLITLAISKSNKFIFKLLCRITL